MIASDRFQLVRQLSEREVAQRYRGSLLGMFWAVLTPLALLAVFTFVFGVIFQARWPGARADTWGFAIVLFVGLIVFQIFSEVVSKAPTLIVSQRNLVKKVVFPLELLPVVALVAALVQAGIAFAVLLAVQAIFGDGVKPTALLLPLALVPACLVTLGLAWFLAALGVYVRDVVQIVPPAVTAMMFLTPIFYPPEALPGWTKALTVLNPLAYAVNDVRAVLVSGTIPDVGEWLMGIVLCGFVAFLGYAFFMKTRKGFADVL